ncbi:MAG: hypothetical protein CMJ18_03320 [Phycisphaeraceae bacterium]|nr:hypothetical protein [Phycisphaeraceae bacterium]
MSTGNGIAKHIDASGVVVGLVYKHQVRTGTFIYDLNSDTLIEDLLTLVPEGGHDWSLARVWDMNDKGQIVCTGTNPQGQQTIFVLTPIE